MDIYEECILLQSRSGEEEGVDDLSSSVIELCESVLQL